MPSKNRYVAAGMLTAGLLTAGGVSMAQAASDNGTTSNVTVSSNSTQDHTRPGPDGHGRPGTKVTGDEATKVGQAVKAKDADATVKDVMKDPSGNYHVHATSSGKNVEYRVSKDLKTVTKDTHDGRGPGHHRGTPVTKAVSDQVSAAVKAKDSGVSVERVVKGPDGSYMAEGTKSGQRVHFHVGKDLKTVTEMKGGPRGDGHGPRHGQDGPGKPGDDGKSGQNTTSGSSASPTTGG